MLDQILSVFVSDAYAADTVTSAPQQGGGMSFILMFAVFFIFVYFAIWRPQSKRAKEQRSLMDSLAKGDEIMTAGGILGRISKITDHYVLLTIANNIDIYLQKSSIVTVLPKGTLKSIE